MAKSGSVPSGLVVRPKLQGKIYGNFPIWFPWGFLLMRDHLHQWFIWENSKSAKQK